MSTIPELSESLCSYGATLYGHLIASQKGKQVNALISPFSLYTALAMTLAGSKGSTEKELRQALHLTAPVNHEAVGSLLKSYSAQSGDVELNSANRMVLLRALKISEAYKSQLEKSYQAECESVAHLPSDEAKRQHINQFVEKATKEKIKDLLPSGAVDSNSMLMLINALYFKGAWKARFPTGNTKPGTFRKHDNSNIEIPMMSDSQNLPYEELEDIPAQALKLPFKGDKNCEMLIVLPFGNDGLPEVQQYLEKPENLKKLLSLDYPEVKVKVMLPKFKLSKHPMIELIGPLKKMGIANLFDQSKADLSKISDEMQLYVSGIFHQAVLEVDEEGATAAAATAFRVAARMALREPIFKVDRPFFVIIVQDKIVPLFMGHVWEPEAF